MTSTELSRQNEALKKVTDELDITYRKKMYGNKVRYISNDGVPFSVCAFPGRYALVIEYAENEEDALLGRFEDGDLFYLDDLAGKDLISAMENEINSQTI